MNSTRLAPAGEVSSSSSRPAGAPHPEVCGNCGHAPELHRESFSTTGSGCVHFLCEGCREYQEATNG